MRSCKQKINVKKNLSTKSRKEQNQVTDYLAKQALFARMNCNF